MLLYTVVTCTYMHPGMAYCKGFMSQAALLIASSPAATGTKVSCPEPWS